MPGRNETQRVSPSPGSPAANPRRDRTGPGGRRGSRYLKETKGRKAGGAPWPGKADRRPGDKGYPKPPEAPSMIDRDPESVIEILRDSLRRGESVEIEGLGT